jgi:hypothetical protein
VEASTESDAEAQSMSLQINYLAAGRDSDQIGRIMSESFGCMVAVEICTQTSVVEWSEVQSPEDYARLALDWFGYLTRVEVAGRLEREEARRGWVLVTSGHPVVETSPAGLVDGCARLGRLYLFDSEDDSLRQAFQRVQRKIRSLSEPLPLNRHFWAFPEARQSADTMIDLVGKYPMGFKKT